MNHILYQVFKIIFSVSSKNHEAVTNNPPTTRYINKIEHTITFKIKKGYNLQLLKPEVIKLLERIKKKITKDENGDNMSHLGMPELALVHCNIINNDYQQHSIVLYTFVPNKSFGQLLDISPKHFIF